MKQARKPKRTATVVLDSGWQQTTDGRYYRYYTDEQGQAQVEWYQPEDPRTGGVDAASFAYPFPENELSNEQHYTHTAIQDATAGYTKDVLGVAGGYVEGSTEEDLAAGVEGLAVGDNEEEGEEQGEEDSVQHTRESHNATGSSPKGKASERRGSKREDKSSSSKPKKDTRGTTDRKGKGKEKETRHHDEPPGRSHATKPPQQHRAPREKRGHAHGHGHQAAPSDATGDDSQGDTQPVDAGYGAKSAPAIDAATPYYPTGQQYMRVAHGGQQVPHDQVDLPVEQGDIEMPSDTGYASGYSAQDPNDNYEGYARAVAQSLAAVYPGTTGYGAYPPGEPSSLQQTFCEPSEAEGDDGTVTPTNKNPGLEMDTIHGTVGAFESLDPRFQVEPSSRFQPGEVFKILWSEPQGQPLPNPQTLARIESCTEKLQIEDARGMFYVGIRRFIVIAVDQGNCTCVPILTYENRGCKKPGVKASKHGIVYSDGTKPKLLDGEPKLGVRPVRMRIYAPGEQLARESRVNYAKLTTVEHNVKVFFIGSIHRPDFSIVREAVDRCWAAKNRSNNKRGHERR